MVEVEFEPRFLNPKTRVLSVPPQRLPKGTGTLSGGALYTGSGAVRHIDTVTPEGVKVMRQSLLLAPERTILNCPFSTTHTLSSTYTHTLPLSLSQSQSLYQINWQYVQKATGLPGGAPDKEPTCTSAGMPEM